MRLTRTEAWQAFRADIERVRSDEWLPKRLWWLVEPPMWAVLVYRLGNALRQSLPPRIAGAAFSIFHLVATPSVRALTGIEISFDARIGPGLRIYHGLGTVIGHNAVIGDNCTIRQGCNVGANVRSADMPTIGNNVSLGAQSQILGPVLVGDRVRIGPGSVVLRDVPSDVSVFGVPARVVAER